MPCQLCAEAAALDDSTHNTVWCTSTSTPPCPHGQLDNKHSHCHMQYEHTYLLPARLASAFAADCASCDAWACFLTPDATLPPPRLAGSVLGTPYRRPQQAATVWQAQQTPPLWLPAVQASSARRSSRGSAAVQDVQRHPHWWGTGDSEDCGAVASGV
jgi:hypothetical protein